jgi:hypothetical protein
MKNSEVEINFNNMRYIMALKESNKNRKKPVTQQEEPAIQTDTTIWMVLIICLVIAFFAAL